MLRRLTKLKAMSGAEVMHRIRYRAFCEMERRVLLKAWHAPDRLRAGLAPNLAGRTGWQDALLASRAASRSNFHGDLARRQEYRAIFDAHYRPELDDMRRRAAEAREGRVRFFGREFNFGLPIPWHRDPLTGQEWPKRFHQTVPVNGSDSRLGDVKYVWELNRHQFMVDLARSCYLDARADDATVLHALHASWMDACPYGTGVPWANALEPAFRVFSWLWCYHLCAAAGALAPADELRWLAGFLDHGRFLCRHLERFSSPYNHLAGEASALYQLGALFPEFAEAARWQATGKAILEETLGEQFHEDGGSVEQSTFYHHATLGFYLLAALIGRRIGDAFSPAVWAAIERACDFSLALAWPDGRVPSIGGADDGKPLRMEHLPFWDFRYYLAIGAVLFERPDFARAAGRFWEDAFWILGPAGREAFEALPHADPEPVRVFPRSGYVVARSGWSPEADYACFDCGPQAGGLRRDGVPSAAHGHADCLSVIAALGGRRILVDPGFYCYNCTGGWEIHFRKTAPHNTIAIDGRDQARHIAKMAWAETYAPVLEDVSRDAGIVLAAGHHDGYARGPRGVVHRRQVLFGVPGCVAIADELIGSGAHDFVVNFQFAPGELSLEDGAALFDGRFRLAWRATVALRATTQAGGPLPDGGWIAPSLGVKVPAPRLMVQGGFEAAADVRILTLLSDAERVAADIQLDSSGALEATVRGTRPCRFVFAAAGGGRASLRAIELVEHPA